MYIYIYCIQRSIELFLFLNAINNETKYCLVLLIYYYLMFLMYYFTSLLFLGYFLITKTRFLKQDTKKI